MRQSIKSIFLLCLILGMNSIFAQDNYSLQLNGGLISPRKSSNGPIGMIKFNYSLNSTFIIYLYGGYSVWDQNEIVLKNVQEVYSSENQIYFHSYNRDSHTLIPIYLGSQVTLHTNNLFSSFLEFEFGYSYLGYMSYDNIIISDPESGEVLDYYADRSTGSKVNENLFGIGVGAGLSHSISSIIDLLFSIKLNTIVNENYNGLFSSEGTYTSFLIGISHNL